MSDYIHEANARIDERFESQLLNRVGDALDDEGSQIYIRKTGGRLMWIVGNRYRGGAPWQELTEHLAKERGIELAEARQESLELLKQKIMNEEPELYEIGWYQDLKGDLYQFDGKTWVGVVPNKKEKETLEFLG